MKISKIKERRKIKESSEKNTQLVEDKIWRQLRANAGRTRKLKREPYMKKTVKRRARRNPKRLGLAQINFEVFLKG